MFKHKASDGTRNLCGKKLAVLRKNLPEKTSQRLLAEKMQIKGIDMDKTAIKRIENGERYVTDIELKASLKNFFRQYRIFIRAACGFGVRDVFANQSAPLTFSRFSGIIRSQNS